MPSSINTGEIMHKLGTEEKVECACIGCTEQATHVWGGRPHCEDCMPPMYGLGKHKEESKDE